MKVKNINMDEFRKKRSTKINFKQANGKSNNEKKII